VTAVVFTTIELDTALVGSATLPAADATQTAGDALEEQLVVVRYAGTMKLLAVENIPPVGPTCNAVT
jgi:hypothetical protein